MPFSSLETLEIIEAFENFLDPKRPAENLREEIDLDYRIEDSEIIIYEMRPRWHAGKELSEFPIVKISFIKSKNQWRVFWMKSDRKWHASHRYPYVNSVKEFLELIGIHRRFRFR
jgi:hypothetical protein